MPDVPEKKNETWLVAAWPGMANVGVTAAAFLVKELGMNQIEELDTPEHFDLQHIEISDGIASAPEHPKTYVFEWKNLGTGPDLLVILGQAQPTERQHKYCSRIIDLVMRYSVTRVTTFASLATQLHPTDSPQVFSVATNETMLSTMRELDVTILDQGQIGGANGVLLASAAENGLDAACLLGEIPFFAAGVDNPRASKAVLEAYQTMAGLSLDLTPFEKQAEIIDDVLLQLLERMKEAARRAQESDEESEFSTPEYEPDSDEEEKAVPKVDPDTRKKIEGLFELAKQDRSHAVRLKEELDRLGVFKDYEDRFLDLFKRGE